jgi:hypothetical protein
VTNTFRSQFFLWLAETLDVIGWQSGAVWAYGKAWGAMDWDEEERTS